MKCYYITLSKDKKCTEKIIRERLESGFIQLELDDKNAIHQPLTERGSLSTDTNFEAMIKTFLQVKMGDLFLVFNDKQPVALVRVLDNYSFNKKQKPCCQHRYAIGVLTYFADSADFFQQISIDNDIFDSMSVGLFGHIQDEKLQVFKHSQVSKHDAGIIAFYKETLYPHPALKTIHIQNFKNFQHLAITHFKRINVITGKNNAGKTNLLEACYLYLKYQENDSQGLSHLIDMMNMRHPLCDTSAHHSDHGVHLLTYRGTHKQSPLHLNALIGAGIHLSKDSLEKNADELNKNLSVIANENRLFFITPHLVTNTTLIQLFSRIQLLRKRHFFKQSNQR